MNFPSFDFSICWNLLPASSPWLFLTSVKSSRLFPSVSLSSPLFSSTSTRAFLVNPVWISRRALVLRFLFCPSRPAPFSASLISSASLSSCSLAGGKLTCLRLCACVSVLPACSGTGGSSARWSSRLRSLATRRARSPPAAPYSPASRQMPSVVPTQWDAMRSSAVVSRISENTRPGARWVVRRCSSLFEM